MVTLYTIDCPKCKVIETMLKKKQIQYECVRDIDLMLQKGFKDCPKLEVDGQLYGFTEAVKLIQEGKVG